MKVVILTGSPHKAGTSFALTDSFMEGLLAKGHSVQRYDSAFLSIHGCLGCDHCRVNDGVCVHKDDMKQINESILEADMVVFTTPLYYFGMSSQLKQVIDRFYAINAKLMQAHKKSMLLVTCADTEKWATDAIISHYETVLRYLNWENKGILCAEGIAVKSDYAGTTYLQDAYDLGFSI